MDNGSSDGPEASGGQSSVVFNETEHIGGKRNTQSFTRFHMIFLSDTADASKQRTSKSKGTGGCLQFDAGGCQFNPQNADNSYEDSQNTQVCYRCHGDNFDNFFAR